MEKVLDTIDLQRDKQSFVYGKLQVLSIYKIITK